MLSELADCRGAMGVSREIELIETPLVQSPALFGLLRPRLLTPPDLEERFDRAEIRLIFLHELAHVKRSVLCLA